MSSSAGGGGSNLFKEESDLDEGSTIIKKRGNLSNIIIASKSRDVSFAS